MWEILIDLEIENIEGSYTKLRFAENDTASIAKPILVICVLTLGL